MALMLRTAGASGLVVAGVLAAVVVGQLPAVGVVRPGVVVTPSSAGQRLVCPGPVVAVGAAGSAADELTAAGRPTRTVGTAGGRDVRVRPLGRGGIDGGGTVPRLVAAGAADGEAGAIAGAQLETVSGGDAAGLAATSCTAPVSEAWFAAGATTTGRTTLLTLANASGVDAQVRVEIWTEDGPVDTGTSGGVLVAARGRSVVSLSSLAPTAGGTVVHITSTGGRVGAALEQRTVRGLESGGVDFTGATSAPAKVQVIAGLRIAGAETVAAAQRDEGYADVQPVVRVLAPGTGQADVRIVVAGPAGEQALGRQVTAGVVTDFPVPDLVDGTYTVRVVADRPLVAGARVSVVGDPDATTTADDLAGGAPSGSGTAADEEAAVGSDAGLVGGDGPSDTAAAAAVPTGVPTSTARGVDLAWFAAGRPLGRAAAVAVVDGPSPLLTLANTDAAPAVVELSGATELRVEVPGDGTVSVPVERGVIALTAASGIVAGVSYAGAAAIAGYPVAPADQAARPIRVSR